MSDADLKLRIIQLIEDFEKNNLLQEVYDLLNSAKSSETKDWWDELSEGHLARLKQAKSDFEAGRVLSHEQVKQMLKNG